MKAYQVVCLICMIIIQVVAGASVDYTPTLSSDVTAPVTTNTVYLKKPFCSFDNITDTACKTPNTCQIWLASSLGSAISTFDSSKTDPDLISLSPYPTAFNTNQRNFFLTQVGPRNSFLCSAAGTTPSYFLVGADGACSTANCNGVLPERSTMRFKYLLLSPGNTLVAETNWSENIPLKTPSVDYTPTLSPDVTAPVTTNTVYLKKPFCSFDNITDAACKTPNMCQIWLASSLDSAISTFDSSKTNPDLISSSPYPTAFNTNQKNYFLTEVGPQNSFLCSAAGTTPSYFLVGADGACNTANCNGVLPERSTMRFKYLLFSPRTMLLAETNWSENITLKTLKNPDSLGSGYAGRSAAMVVITSILCTAAALLLLLLLIALILACCASKGKTQSYDARRQTSFLGSLRIPNYDVHHLKNPSPYDNSAYEEDLRKKRYTTNATVPQKSTTVINTVQTSSPDTITMQKM